MLLLHPKQQILELPGLLLDLLLQRLPLLIVILFVVSQLSDGKGSALEAEVEGQVLLKLLLAVEFAVEEGSLLVYFEQVGIVLDGCGVVVLCQFIVPEFIELGPTQVGPRIVLTVQDRPVEVLRVAFLQSTHQVEARQSLVKLLQGSFPVLPAQVHQETVEVSHIAVGVQLDGLPAQSGCHLQVTQLQMQSPQVGYQPHRGSICGDLCLDGLDAAGEVALLGQPSGLPGVSSGHYVLTKFRESYLN